MPRTGVHYVAMPDIEVERKKRMDALQAKMATVLSVWYLLLWMCCRRKEGLPPLFARHVTKWIWSVKTIEVTCSFLSRRRMSWSKSWQSQRSSPLGLARWLLYVLNVHKVRLTHIYATYVEVDLVVLGIFSPAGCFINDAGARLHCRTRLHMSETISE